MKGVRCSFCYTIIRGIVCYDPNRRALHFGCWNNQQPPEDGSRVLNLLAEIWDNQNVHDM